MSTDTAVETPTWDMIRDWMSKLAIERGDWAGIPLPVEGVRMVLEPRYPYQGLANNMFVAEDHETNVDDLMQSMAEQLGDPEAKLVHGWYSQVLNDTIYIFRLSNGKVRHWRSPHKTNDGLDLLFSTLNVASSAAWSTKAEVRAIKKLKELVGDHKFRMYVMTGCFVETSPRSHVTYMFRRLRPTIAMKFDASGNVSKRRVLCSLCMHPIGYYEASWAGSMVPTDEVVAHLLMMRGDEHRYWRTCEQHQSGSEAFGR